MRRLLEDFQKNFDLDHRIRGHRLSDLVEHAVRSLDANPLPDWGSPGPAAGIADAGGRFVTFFYRPHLFPDMEEKLRLAHQLQFHLLPRELPDRAPVAIAAVLESYCHLSGDLFGWEMLSDDSFLLWIVDLSGHGVRAGLASALLKIIVSNLNERSRTDRLVGELNEALHACVKPESYSLFATGFFMVVAPDGTARYTSAGHPPPLLRGADGTIRQLRANSQPIGLFPDRCYVVDTTRLVSGDTLLLYTDGLLETTDRAGQEFGLERLSHFLRREFDSPEDITGSLYRAVGEHQDLTTLEDDVTFVAARVL